MQSLLDETAVDFFNQLNMLVSRERCCPSPRLTSALTVRNHPPNLQYGCVTEFCTSQECPVMSAGPRFEYHWQDGVRYRKPTKMSAPGKSYPCFRPTCLAATICVRTVAREGC